MISGNVPKHMVTSARSGFLNGMRSREYEWQKITMMLNMSSNSDTLVDLGAAPMPTRSKGGGTLQDFAERSITVKPVDWDIEVFISHNAMADDQTGTLERRVRSAGDNFQKHLNTRIFSALNAGDSSNFGNAYDGQNFFDSDHVDPNGSYQTDQDNENALALGIANFLAVWSAAQSTRDDQGQFTSYNYDTLVASPAQAYWAAQVVVNPQDADNNKHAINPFASGLRYIIAPELDTTAWYLLATGETQKPLILAQREAPNLLHAWFDPNKPEGGWFIFKFYARYEVYYGDWRTAYQGNT